MAEGGGNLIDPGWWNLGNLDGNMDNLVVDSDLNLIRRPENRTTHSTSEGITEGHRQGEGPTTIIATTQPRVRNTVIVSTGPHHKFQPSIRH